MVRTILITFTVVLLGFALWTFFGPKFPKPQALQVFSNPEAQVFLDDREVGKTPYNSNNVSKNDINLRLVASSAAWVGAVKLTPGTVSIVSRDLSENPLFGAGEIITLEPGRGIFVISIPDGAEVEVDGKKIGQTPILKEDILPGDHRVVVSKEDHISRAVKVTSHKNFKLVLSVQLSLTQEKFAKLSGTTASASLVAKQAKILDTPTGFLRVRDKPTLVGAEIGKVNAGDSFAFLEEQPGWVKIRIPNPPIDGWVSSQYVKIE